jgi:predicted Zn finger-like uncharacterized protein
MQITQCPECATAFKVTPEQLKLADGWVRCGRCGAVFEALKQVQAPTPSGATNGVSQAASQVAQRSAPSEKPVAKPAKAESAIGADLGSAFGPTIASAAEPSFEPSLGPSFDPTWSPASSAHTPRASAKDDTHAQASAQRARRLWLSLSVVLMLGLLWQMVLYKRDWLMAQEPALKSTLSILCAPVGCEPGWPRLPESLQVESSSFVHDPQGFYSVQLRVKNTEHFPLAAPHLELTLLDAYDDIVLRRVFTPQELNLTSAIPPLRDARAGMDFMLDAAVMERVTGYRVLLFYP